MPDSGNLLRIEEPHPLKNCVCVFSMVMWISLQMLSLTDKLN